MRVRLSSSGKSYSWRLVAGLVLVALLAGVFFCMRQEGILKTAVPEVIKPEETTGTDVTTKQETPVVETRPVALPVGDGASGENSQTGEDEELLRQQQEVNKLKNGLNARLRILNKVIEGRDFDRGQTFGEHLDSLKSSMAEAEEAEKDTSNAKRFELAKERYETALKEAEWINRNLELRKVARSLLLAVEAEQKRADEKNASRLAIEDYKPASRNLADARRTYESGDFTAAISALNKARDGFENASRQAHAANVQSHLSSGRFALDGRRWGEAVQEAKAILALEPGNAEAQKLLDDAEAGKKKQQIEALLADAKTAIDDHNWGEAQRKATEVIGLERGNAEAAKLLQAVTDGEKNTGEKSQLSVSFQEFMQRSRFPNFKQAYKGKRICITGDVTMRMKTVKGEMIIEFGNKQLRCMLAPTVPEEDYKKIGEMARNNEPVSLLGEYMGEDKEGVHIIRNCVPLAMPVSQQAQSSFPEMLDLSGVPLKMIKVKAGRFQMGSPEGELGRSDSEKQHWVTLTRDYWLGETEVTQGQWKAVMGDNPSGYKKGDNYPVEQVSWDDAMKFCEKLNQMYFGRMPAGYRFSLPTEAQWEYACRAGMTTALNNGRNLTSKEGHCSNLDEAGWYDENSGGSTHPVAQKKRNDWGFYDMHGNVWEWCSDYYEKYSGDATDPKGPGNGSNRVDRGGRWGYDARCCRSAFRFYDSPSYCGPDLGFRLALVPIQ